MNKLKGKLCAFCMIFSAIVTYSESSNEYDYKTALMSHAGAIETDYTDWRNAVKSGKHPWIESNAEDTVAAVKKHLEDAGYTPEECKKLIFSTFGTDNADEIQDVLKDPEGTKIKTPPSTPPEEEKKDESGGGGESNPPEEEKKDEGAGGGEENKADPEVLTKALTGNTEITYWAMQNDPRKAFRNLDDVDIGKDLNISGLNHNTIKLSEIVQFAHNARNIGYQPNEFLSLYSLPCKDKINTRCTNCTIDSVDNSIGNHLKSLDTNFVIFINVIRSIANDKTYAAMRTNAFLDKTLPLPEDNSNANYLKVTGEHDFFNFLHIFLKKVVGMKVDSNAEATNIAQVVCKWLKYDIPKDAVSLYPKVVSTLVDMMYIAHVEVGKDTIDHNTSRVLSKAALMNLSQRLGGIQVNSNTYNLVGINNLKIDNEAYKVLGLEKSFIDDKTSFLLPVAVLQDKNTSTFSTYDGAPLLLASDIVYICSQSNLPTVSMFMFENKPMSTYHTGYNLMKQSIFIKDVTHDGSYNGAGISKKYGAITNNTYAAKDWGLTAEAELQIDNKYVNLIVAELFSWYTHILDLSFMVGSGMGGTCKTRQEFEAAFQQKIKLMPTTHAFIVKGSEKIPMIGGNKNDKNNKANVAYTPDTVYAGETEYKDNYLPMFGIDADSNAVVQIYSNFSLTGTHLILSLLNSSWAETMLRGSNDISYLFYNINDSRGLLLDSNKPVKASDFNKTNKDGSVNKSRSNISSTVHKLDNFRKALQKISNYTFQGFQPRVFYDQDGHVKNNHSYGLPLATVKPMTGELRTLEFISDVAEGNSIQERTLQDNEPLYNVLKSLSLSK